MILELSFCASHLAVRRDCLGVRVVPAGLDIEPEKAQLEQFRHSSRRNLLGWLELEISNTRNAVRTGRHRWPARLCAACNALLGS
jgi:hypothetical protein